MLVKCFSLACNAEHDLDLDGRGPWTCPTCNGINSTTWGRLRYQDREQRDKQAKEFQSCRP